MSIPNLPTEPFVFSSIKIDMDETIVDENKFDFDLPEGDKL